jgi:hypothetical protein
MPPPVLPAEDPLYRKYVHELMRRGQTPSTYDEFCQRRQGRSDFDLASLLVPPALVQLSTALPVLAPRFALGRIYITPGAAGAIPPEEVCAALRRHAAGDWGALDAHDWQQNERALQHGGRLVSAYATATSRKFWIISEASRDVTTLLLPEEY